MTYIKALSLAAVAALSLGVGGAMAQESAGGADVNSHPAFPDPVMRRSVVTTYEWRTGPSYAYQYSVPSYTVPPAEDGY